MKKRETVRITVSALVKADIMTVWRCWTSPDDIIRWNHASDDWHSPAAVNDLRIGGKFNYRMESRDGKAGFDFWGVYDDVRQGERIAYTMGDGRKAEVSFVKAGPDTKIVEVFEAETENSVELQRKGWQAILDNFKNHAENAARTMIS